MSGTGNKNFPASSSDSSKPILTGAILKGDEGDAAIVAIPNPSNINLPCDTDGNNVDYTNSDISISIIQGNNTIASGLNNDGWNLQLTNQTNCSVSVSSLIATLTEITENTAEFTLRIYKTGYNDIFVIVSAVKVYQGEIGPIGEQGEQGERGIIGLTGPSGLNASGYIVKKHEIEVLIPQIPIKSNHNNQLLITNNFGGHNLVVGEYVHLYQYENEVIVYNEYTYVEEILSNSQALLNVSYDIKFSTPGGFLRSMRHFARDDQYNYYNNLTNQELWFIDELPVGAKIDQLVFDTYEGSTNFTIDAGYQRLTTVYINNILHNVIYPPIQVDLYDKTRPEYLPYYIWESTSDRRNIYITAKLYGLFFSWADTADQKFRMFVGYKMFSEEEDETISGSELVLENSFILEDQDNKTLIVGNISNHTHITIEIIITRNNLKYHQLIYIIYDPTTNYTKLDLGSINPYISSNPKLGIIHDHNYDDENGDIEWIIYSSTEDDQQGLGDTNVKYKITRI